MEQSLIEKYISIILSQRPELTREELIRIIEEKSKKVKIGNSYKKLYSLFLVAQELGVRLEQASIWEQTVKIGKILPNMRGIALIGRVIGVSTRSVGKQGEEVRVTNLYVGDETGQCVVVLWREKAELPELLGIKEDDIIQVQGGYSKEGRFGLIEVHISGFGTIQKMEEDFNLPKSESFFIPISEISERTTQVNTKGIIKWVSPQKGKLKRMTIEDGTNEITVSLWQNVSKKVNEEDIGKWVYLVGARTRIGINGKVELSLDESGCLRLGAIEEGYTREQKIKDLKEGSTANIKGKVLKVFSEDIRNIPGLGTRKVKEVIIYDDTGMATLTIWASENEEIPEIMEGKIIRAIGAKVRKQTPSTIIYANASNIKEIEDKHLEKLPVIQIKPLRVKDIKEDMKNIVFEGLVISNVKEQEFTDENGRTIEKAEFNVADDTGLIRVVAWKEDCLKVKNLKPNTPIRILWSDTRKDQFTSETYILITKKTEIESLEVKI